MKGEETNTNAFLDVYETSGWVL